MTEDMLRTFQKGCRVFYLGRQKNKGHSIEPLNPAEETAFLTLLAAYVDRVRCERKRLILNYRLGLSGVLKTSGAVGELLGISGSRVRQLEHRALQELFRCIHPGWNGLMRAA